MLAIQAQRSSHKSGPTPALHLTASGAVRGGHLAEKVILHQLVLPKSAAGEPNR
jgi:hypothetical protein